MSQLAEPAFEPASGVKDSVESEQNTDTAVVRHRRRIGELIFNLVIIAAAIGALVAVARNEYIHWDVVGTYLFSPTILQGLGVSILLTVICSVVGYVFGTILALFQLSKVRGLQVIATLYIWVFRAVPQMVQLLLWFNIAAIWPNIALGIPFGPELFSISTRGLINGFVAAVIGLGFAEAAYAAEIVRGGILSVDSGQREAAEALGMTRRRVFFRIVLPQAMRGIMPPLGNSIIGMLKNTSLVSVIAVGDLLYSAQLIYNRNFEVVPLLIVASLWYLVVTTILMLVQGRVERYYGRGYQQISESQAVARQELEQ